MRDIDAISGDVIDVALRIHRDLGPGLLESVYETVLAGKLLQLGYTVDRQKPIDIEFEGQRFGAAFKIDLLVDDRLIVEIKSVDALNKAHLKQLYVSSSNEAARWAAYQFCRSDPQGRTQAGGQQPCPLRVSASPRESIRRVAECLT